MRTYEPVAHAWWRLRTGPVVAWETSSDMVSWETLHEETAYFDMSDTQVVIGAGTDLTSTNAGSAQFDTARIFARPTPLLVPLVEEGWTNHTVTKAVLQEYLGPLLKRRIDTLVLGCTHYPLLKTALRKVVGRNVTLVDSAESCARFVRERLTFLKLLANNRRRRGITRMCPRDHVERCNQVW